MRRQSSVAVCTMALWWFVGTAVLAQVTELVPNGGFEEITSCPNSYLQLELASSWFSVDTTGSLYASCSTDPKISPPTGTCCNRPEGAYQLPYEGENHVGFSNWNTFPNQPIEYIGVALERALLTGEQVYASARVAPDVDTEMFVFNVTFTNAVGIGLVSDTVGLTLSNAASRVTPIAQLREPLADTAAWTLLSGCFTARGGERYLIIGNFLPDAQVRKTFSRYEERFGRTYIFVDDVQLEIYDPYPDTVLVCDDEEAPTFDVRYRDFGITATPCAPVLKPVCLDSVFTQVVSAQREECVLRDTMLVVPVPGASSLSDSTVRVCRGEQIPLGPPLPGKVVWDDGTRQTSRSFDRAGRYGGTIENDCGTYTFAYVVEVVDCSCDVAGPTAFSPNGDGINDVLAFYLTCPSPTFDFVLEVYDRWGGLLKETRSGAIPPVWDGHAADGAALNNGTYVYVLRYSVRRDAGALEARAVSGSFDLLR